MSIKHPKQYIHSGKFNNFFHNVNVAYVFTHHDQLLLSLKVFSSSFSVSVSVPVTPLLTLNLKSSIACVHLLLTQTLQYHNLPGFLTQDAPYNLFYTLKDNDRCINAFLHFLKHIWSMFFRVVNAYSFNLTQHLLDVDRESMRITSHKL